MKTLPIEKESLRNRIIGRDGKERINMRPFVAEFVLKKVGKEIKVQKDYLRPTQTTYLGAKGCTEDLDQRRYTWEAPQFVPLSIGSCVNYNEFETVDGMFEDGQWRDMTFFEIRKHLSDQAAQDKALEPSKPKPSGADASTDSSIEPAIPADPYASSAGYAKPFLEGTAL